ATLGIDAEVHDRLPDGILHKIARPEERIWMETRAGDGIWWDRLLFSAKESIFKAWFPVTRRWLDFHDVTVTIDPDGQTFRTEFHVEPPVVDGRTIPEFPGRYLVHGSHVLTAVSIARAHDA